MGKDYIHIYDRILFSHKKKEILQFGTILVDDEAILPCEVKSDKERQVLYDLIFM